MTWDGEKLKLAREAKGLNQAELAEKLGVEPPTISRWESGINSPRPRQIPSIASLLDRMPEYFQKSDIEGSKLESLERRLAALEGGVVTGAGKSRLIEIFDTLSPDRQDMVLAFAESLLKGADQPQSGSRPLKKS